MSEKLTIRNFGPIKNVELDLKKFNVIIGENGTGKSTIAKILSFCKYFSNIEGAYFDETRKETINHGMEEVDIRLEKWGLLEYIRNDSFVCYECKDYKYWFEKKQWEFSSFNPKEKKYKNGKQYLLTSSINPITKQFKNLLDKYSQLERNGRLGSDFFENFVGGIMDNPFFVFTERGLQSIFSLGKDFTSNLSDPLFRYFVDMDKITKNFKGITELTPLKIEYRNVDGKSEIRKIGEKLFTSLPNAASGYKSLAPIVLLVKYYDEFRKKKKSFIIEEPEQNIFPTTQYELVKFFIENLDNSNSIFLTTHSPYILTSLNNLLQAHITGTKKRNTKKVSEVIPQKNWLDPKLISAYMLLPNGKCESIFDNKEKLIKAEMIDSVSTELNKEFDEILRIEFDIKKSKENA